MCTIGDSRNQIPIFLLVLLFFTCSFSSPEAPSWEVPVNLPLVANTVYIRDLVEIEDEFFFGDYGPWRFMDYDSVLTSVVSDTLNIGYEWLQYLPEDEPGTIITNAVSWGGNPLDEIQLPQFYRAWFEVEVSHNLPGHVDYKVVVQGWDDDGRSCGIIQVEGELGASLHGEIVTGVAYAPQEDVFKFINPSSTHSLPDSLSAIPIATYTPTGTPVSPEAELQVKLSLLSAFDLTFETTVVSKRAVVEKLIIAPEGEPLGHAHVSADITNQLEEATFVAQVANNLSLSGEGFFRMGHDSASVITDPELLIGPFAVLAAPIDPLTGKPTGVTRSRSRSFLDEEDTPILHNEGSDYDTLYFSMEYVLASTAGQRICISAADSIQASTAIVITTRIETKDE